MNTRYLLLHNFFLESELPLSQNYKFEYNDSKLYVVGA